MTIFTLIEKLSKARRQHVISAAAQGLFLELVSINNDMRWSDTFKSSNIQLCAALNTSEKTLIGLRQELVTAGLLTYGSGKSKRLPGVYSLNGYPLGLPMGCKNYSPNDSQSDSPTGSPSVVKTPDLLRDKSKEIDINLKGIEVVVLTRAAEIENAITDFCEPPAEKKEKNSAQKENDVPVRPVPKAFPSLADAIASVETKAPGQWRNVLQHHIAKEVKNWSKLSPEEQKAYYDRRQELFTNFYEYKEDQYRIRYPTVSEMATNFYHWAEIQINKSPIIKSLQNAASNIHTKHSTTGRTNRNEDKRNELRDFKDQSSEFLRRTAG